MSRLPACSGRKAAAAFARIGCALGLQTSSHMILRHPNRRRRTVPDHPELAKGAPRSLVREADGTKEQFVELLG